MIVPTLVLFSILSFANALYDSNDDVVILNANSFKNKVIGDDGIWIVEFYAPWCGHCKNLAPEMKKASTALKGLVSVGVVDCDSEKSLCQDHSVSGYPTIKVFGSNKNKPFDYNGGRSAENIVDFILEKAAKLVKKRLNPNQKEESEKKEGGSKGEVVTLTEDNFEKMVFDSADTWMVEFFAPWCGHCQRLKPEYESAAGQLGGVAKLGAVDATVHQNLAAKYGVQGYPTLFVFTPGNRQPQQYPGGRTASDIVSHMKTIAMENKPAPKPVELTSQKDFDDSCKETQLCIIAVLPDLLDCQTECRNKYIKMLEKVAEKHKSQLWKYLWTSAAKYSALEEALNIGGFGYPAMSVLNLKKGKFAPLRGSFSDPGLHEFLRDVSVGGRSVALFDVKKLPEIERTEPWDGKDGKPPVEEEISLDDLKDEF